jgi:5-methylcytosine-specific restriction endonuclease McrA
VGRRASQGFGIRENRDAHLRCAGLRFESPGVKRAKRTSQRHFQSRLQRDDPGASRRGCAGVIPTRECRPRVGDAALPCWRRRAAWINTAGSFDMTWCMDARGSLIHRDAPQGTLYAWDADHIVARDQGGPDIPTNLRALKAASHRL